RCSATTWRVPSSDGRRHARLVWPASGCARRGAGVSSGMLTAIVAVVAVAALSMILRRFSGSGSEQSAMPTTQPEADEPLSPQSEDEADDESTETVAITSDGWAFVPDDDEVQLVPPAPETDD